MHTLNKKGQAIDLRLGEVEQYPYREVERAIEQQKNAKQLRRELFGTAAPKVRGRNVMAWAPVALVGVASARP